MNIDWKKVVMAGGLALALLALFVVIWGMFRQAGQNQNGLTASSTALFGATAPAAQNGVSGGGLGTQNGGNVPPSSGGGAVVSAQMIFKIADGPVVSAVLVDTGVPTTTSARYVSAEDGHIYEQVLDVAGAMPRTLSSITIPGVARAVWTERGDGVLLQYLQGGTIKTVHLTLFATTSTTTLATVAVAPVVRFLPDNVASVASSPDGKLVAYLLRTGTGSDVYTAAPDGNNAKKIFSMPLAEIDLSWPATSTMFLYTKSAGGVPGLGFSANVKTGLVSPMLYGVGITGSINPLFSHVLYRTDTGTGAATYLEPLSTGQSFAVTASASLAPPLPETCVWNPMRPLQAYCSAPAASAPSNYLELWHRGESSAASALVAVDALNPTALLMATPGSRDGGEVSDMRSLTMSPGAHYLSFISKDDEKLWGVRLGQ